MHDLAPTIFRQRAVVEGLREEPVSAEDIVAYLNALSDVLGMTALGEVVTHRSDLYGWAGWIHWETSGAHFYAWDEPEVFFSVDIYTCKQFEIDKAVAFTVEFFGASSVAAKVV